MDIYRERVSFVQFIILTCVYMYVYTYVYYYYSTGPSMCSALVFFVWAIIDTLIPILILAPIIVVLSLCIKER